MNKLILVGRLGGDPELTTTSNGTHIAKFSVADNRKSANGESVTEWFRVVAFGRLAEICDQYLNKGSQVYIEGRIQQRQYEAQDGTTRTSVEVIANELQMLGSKEISHAV